VSKNSRSIVAVSTENGDLAGALKRRMRMRPPWQGPQMIFDGKVLNSVQLSTSASEHLYKIAQEAVTNAKKHSMARNITLSINVRSTRIVIKVTDDGGVMV